MAKVSKARRQELYDIRKILETPEGARFMWRILGMTGVFPFVAPFIPGGPEGDRATSYNLGRRSIGATIQADILEACPNRYASMIVESNSKGEEKETSHVVEETETVE